MMAGQIGYWLLAVGYLHIQHMLSFPSHGAGARRAGIYPRPLIQLLKSVSQMAWKQALMSSRISFTFSIYLLCLMETQARSVTLYRERKALESRIPPTVF